MLPAIRHDNMKGPRPKLLIFDMDGTLADTSTGIFESIRQVARTLGLRVPSDEELMQTSSGRLGDDFQKLWGIDDEQADRALKIFGEYYEREGHLKSSLYPGMKELLKDLEANGYKLAVATMKLDECAKKQAKVWGISEVFDSINGADLFGRMSKADLIENSMLHADATPDQTVMIGDTGNDLAGAKGCDMRFIAVTYGFGFTREICEEKGFVFAENTNDLRKLLL